jgi:hypothetical protein
MVNARLQMLSRAGGVLRGHEVELSPTETTLASLLAPALSSEHVKWALLEPILIYASALHTFVADGFDQGPGEQLVDDVDAWASRMPIQDLWASLSIEEVADQLATLDVVLLRSDSARARFRGRLKRQFADIPAVVKALGNSGVAYDHS